MKESRLEFDLRFAVLTDRAGSEEMRYFRSPGDAEGVLIRLTAIESGKLAGAVSKPGFHSIERDDTPALKIVERKAA